jgi:hypothetical protein
MIKIFHHITKKIRKYHEQITYHQTFILLFFIFSTIVMFSQTNQRSQPTADNLFPNANYVLV